MWILSGAFDDVTLTGQSKAAFHNAVFYHNQSMFLKGVVSPELRSPTNLACWTHNVGVEQGLPARKRPPPYPPSARRCKRLQAPLTHSLQGLDYGNPEPLPYLRKNNYIVGVVVRYPRNRQEWAGGCSCVPSLNLDNIRRTSTPV